MGRLYKFNGGIVLFALIFIQINENQAQTPNHFRSLDPKTETDDYDYDYDYGDDCTCRCTEPQEDDRALSTNPDDVQFFLYNDRSNFENRQELVLNNTNSITTSSYSSSLNTVFLIHGFRSDGNSEMPTLTKNAYLNWSMLQNIIVVDWGKLNSMRYRDYWTVVENHVPIVYNRVADFIIFLLKNNFSRASKIYLVGFSLGAHISGAAGNLTQIRYRRKIGRISGLDPPDEGFQTSPHERPIEKNDARFVDVYHTSILGTRQPSGHADFFVNGGQSQPGCTPFIGAGCSHSFAYRVFANSILNDFVACKCNPQFYYSGQNQCPGNCSEKSPAGNPCPPTAQGQFNITAGSNAMPLANADDHDRHKQHN